jgi:DNA-binding MarR family transcriptional regulator
MEAKANTSRALDSVLIEHAAEQFRRISWRMRASSKEDWTSLRLTRSQLRILAQLQEGGPASVSELAGKLQLTLPSISATTNRLVRAGLLDRQGDPSDRRRVINLLTADGSAVIERLEQGRRALLVAALANLDPGELDLLAGGLTALERALR